MARLRFLFYKVSADNENGINIYVLSIMRFESFSVCGKDIRIPVAESYKDCMTLIKSDRYRLTGKKESSVSIIVKSLNPVRRPILFWLRLCQYRGRLYLLCRVMYEFVSRRAQVQIPVSTKIGFGFYIGHEICMVVNGGTVIGNNVNLSQFLNIGTNHRTPALIGDNVWIGPQVSIVEDVQIGCNASIGAGAVVVRDVPENATVAGVPAKVINYDNPGRFVNRRYSISEDAKA